MDAQTSPSKYRSILFGSNSNPYDPPGTAGDLQYDSTNYRSLFLPYRLDRLVIAAVLASMVNAVSICIFHSHGTGVIGTPILTPLAAQSIVWIPIVCLAGPILIPSMPDVCRQTFATLFLSVGVTFSINNLSGHYLGKFIFVETYGIYPTFTFCLLPAFATLGVTLVRARDRLLAVGHMVAWALIIAAIYGAFFLLGAVV